MRASVGHVADLPSKGLAVDVDNGFKPTYELTPRGKDVVKELRAALKDASELYLATDEDREGEAISWHLLEAPEAEGAGEADGVPRDHPLGHRARRRQPPGHRLRAGRRGRDPAHPRPAVRLRGVAGAVAAHQAGGCRRAGCRAPRSASSSSASGSAWPSWPPATGTSTPLMATAPAFTATLVAVDGTKVATGKDFGPDGRPTGDVVVLDEAAARGLADGLTGQDLDVRSVEERPYRSSPKAPFMTSTLQQEGGRKLRLSAAAGDAPGPGPLRAGLHHLHAHRLHGPVRRGRHRGPVVGAGAVRRALPVAPARARTRPR